MSDPLSVALNRDRLHDVEVEERYVADGPFVVELTNHGEAMHVHLHLDDQLSRVAKLEANNHYVEEGATVTVQVGANPQSDPVSGKLKVVTGYGSETTYVDVTVEERTTDKGPIEVDEDLGRPQRRVRTTQQEPGGVLERLRTEYDDAVLAAASLAVVLVLLVLAVAAFVDGTLVLVAVGMVVGALLVGAVAMLR